MLVCWILLARIVSIGEILWDVFPDSERLGGATFNFSVNACRLGLEVIFVSAVGDDERGRAARLRAASLGLDPEFIQVVPGAPTGLVSVGLDSSDHPDFTIHRPAAYDRVALDQPALARLAAWNPDWIYYGTLHQMEPASRAVTRELVEALPGARKFYDVNLRRDSYTPELVLQLLSQADAVKLNDDEVAAVEGMVGSAAAGLQEFTGAWSQPMGWRAVAVTRGRDGCAVRIGGDYAEVPGHSITVADTVGAGDAFAAAFLYGLSQNWSAVRTADFANRLGAVVASRAGGLPEWSIGDLRELP
jgi:fructokinase